MNSAFVSPFSASIFDESYHYFWISLWGSGHHRDRITYLKHMGIYKDEKTVVQAGDPERPIRTISNHTEKEDEELKSVIANLQTEA